jgi:excinuclease ABC subunit A
MSGSAVIEHDLAVVAQSDWIIDMGPKAGDEGGQMVIAGTPWEVAEDKRSKTSTCLHRAL